MDCIVSWPCLHNHIQWVHGLLSRTHRFDYFIMGGLYQQGLSMFSAGNIFPLFLIPLSHNFVLQWFNLFVTNGLAFLFTIFNFLPMDCLYVFRARFSRTIPPSSSLSSSSENLGDLNCEWKMYHRILIHHPVVLILWELRGGKKQLILESYKSYWNRI